jgi:hypothetical protein
MTDSFADVPVDDRATVARLKRNKHLRRVTIADFPKDWLPDRPSSSTLRRDTTKEEEES